MKIYLTDICCLCSPDVPIADTPDVRMAHRIKARVFAELDAAPAKRTGRTVKTIALIAAIISLLSTTAFAISRYHLAHKPVSNASVSGYQLERDDAGEILNMHKEVFPDAGMVFSFTGPDEISNVPEFRCFWLPEEPDTGGTDAEGWSSYLAVTGEDTELPYIISSGAAASGCTLVLNGAVSVIKEEYWGDWYLLELHSDYTNCTLRWPSENANYILLFNEQNGFLIIIGGTLDMETLEHIARELEIRDSGRPSPVHGFEEDLGQIDIGRG